MATLQLAASYCRGQGTAPINCHLAGVPLLRVRASFRPLSCLPPPTPAPAPAALCIPTTLVPQID